MKNLILVLVLMAATSPSVFAAGVTKKQVNCATPKGLSGVYSSVKGELKLKKLQSGQSQATGELTFSVRVRAKITPFKVKVAGVYDDVNGIEYATLGSTTKGFESSMFYLNFGEKNTSYVEYNEQSFLMNCVNSL